MPITFKVRCWEAGGALVAVLVAPDGRESAPVASIRADVARLPGVLDAWKETLRLCMLGSVGPSCGTPTSVREITYPPACESN